MAKELLINIRPYETRVALVDGGTVVEFNIERHQERSIAGDIYKGSVARVVKGMEAAFVDIGLPKAAFIYLGASKLPGLKDIPFNHQELAHDETHFSEGQEVLIQVAREPLGSKGARVTTHITLPGRNLVLIPGINHIGISRRIESEREKNRLRELVSVIKPENHGFIVRTAAETADPEKIRLEMGFLIKLWESILTKAKTVQAPYLLHKDLDITLKAVRDLFLNEADQVIIDREEVYGRILKFAEDFIPDLKGHITLYPGEEPLFDHFGVEMEVNRALSKKVWLKSGGYIVIEETEALTAIDVNTGRFVGQRDLEDTILKTNLEAAKEIAYQLRLRNLGGIIIIDFIDMEKEENREKVFSALKEALKKDKTKTAILKISEMGVVEMTRKRTRESVRHTLLQPCPYCDGEGMLKAPATVCHEILRRIEREGPKLSGKEILITAHPAVADLLLEEMREHLEALELQFSIRLSVKGDSAFHQERFLVEPF